MAYSAGVHYGLFDAFDGVVSRYDEQGGLRAVPCSTRDGRLIIPYNVRILRSGSFDSPGAGSFTSIMLPSTLEAIEEDDLRPFCKRYTASAWSRRLDTFIPPQDEPAAIESVTTYGESDDPRTMPLSDAFDFSSVKYFRSFPPCKMDSGREVLVSAGATFELFNRCSHGQVRVVGEGDLNFVEDGVLYVDGGETLARIPAMEGVSSVEVAAPKGVAFIADHAFTNLGARSVVVSMASKPRLWREGFVGAGAVFVTLPDAGAKFEMEAFSGLRSVSLPYASRDATVQYLWGSHGGVVAVSDEAGTGFCRAAWIPTKGRFADKVDRAINDGCGYNMRTLYERGATFDAMFATLDEGFLDGSVKKFAEKIRLAITRLADAECPHRMSDEARAAYAAYVERSARKAAVAFSEEGDAVCLKLLESLGYDVASLLGEARAAAEKARSKPPAAKKPSVAQLMAKAIALMRAGDASGIGALAPVAPKANAVEALRLLKSAAEHGGPGDIDSLFNIFGSFEMPGIVLSSAIAAGNEGTARALIAHGVSMGALAAKGDEDGDRREKLTRKCLESVLVEGLKKTSDNWKQEHCYQGVCTWVSFIRRVAHGAPASHPGFGRGGRPVPVSPAREYFENVKAEKTLPDCVYEAALGRESAPLIAALAEEGLLCPKDLKGLMLACLGGGRTDSLMRQHERLKLAKTLSGNGGLNDEEVTLAYLIKESRFLDKKQFGEGTPSVVRDFAAIAHRGCTPATVSAMCTMAPGFANEIWSADLIKSFPKTAIAFVPHIDPKGFRNTSALLNMLIDEGREKEVRVVCGWDGKVTKKMMVQAIERASSNGNVSMRAVLMEMNERMVDGASGNGLEL